MCEAEYVHGRVCVRVSVRECGAGRDHDRLFGCWTDLSSLPQITGGKGRWGISSLGMRRLQGFVAKEQPKKSLSSQRRKTTYRP